MQKSSKYARRNARKNKKVCQENSQERGKIACNKCTKALGNKSMKELGKLVARNLARR